MGAHTHTDCSILLHMGHYATVIEGRIRMQPSCQPVLKRVRLIWSDITNGYTQRGTSIAGIQARVLIMG